MKTRILSLLSAVLLCLSLCPVSHAEEAPDPATTPGNGSPYYIMVNRTACTVTIYTLGEDGMYSVPLKAMICSVGREGDETPVGTYAVTGYKARWLHMIDDSYGQFCTQFYGNYLFHSVCYSKQSSDSLFTEEYNDLGTAVSHGCVRLQTVDAKWIYDNCPVETTVIVYEDAENPGPLGQPKKSLNYLDPEDPNSNWDPTDPDEANPWHSIEIPAEPDARLVACSEPLRMIRLPLVRDAVSKFSVQPKKPA